MLKQVCFVAPGVMWPERGGTSELLYNLLREFGNLGITSYLITYYSKIYDGYLAGIRHYSYIKCEIVQRHSLMRQRKRLPISFNYEAVKMSLSSGFRHFIDALLRCFDSDVVVVTTCWPSLPATVTAKSYGTPSVLYISAIESHPCHGLNIFDRTFARTLEDIGIARTSRVITVSEYDRDLIVRRGAPPEKVKLVPNFVDCSRYAKVKEDKIAEIKGRYDLNGGAVVFIGGLDYPPNRLAVKRICEEIAPRVIADVPNAKFLVIGRSPPREFNHPSVMFMGHVYGDELAPYLLASDVAIAPIEFGTGTRLKILEYFAAGKPVVSTSTGALGLDVSNGINILIEDDYRRFSDQIVRLLTNYGLSKSLGDEALKLCRAKHDSKIVVQQFLKVLEEA
ncbi:MAG: glycosyltransferase family 4 protein [archaeon]|nr:glycosyltransferase family 4 protein [archaeon]MCP8319366.1 glycosyltransferase family 4 protein [archaeon]